MFNSEHMQNVINNSKPLMFDYIKQLGTVFEISEMIELVKSANEEKLKELMISKGLEDILKNILYHNECTPEEMEVLIDLRSKSNTLFNMNVEEYNIKKEFYLENKNTEIELQLSELKKSIHDNIFICILLDPLINYTSR